jgi:D-alanyl-D-alanine carboxypeptidase (penicillin-binding protein 5/6)
MLIREGMMMRKLFCFFFAFILLVVSLPVSSADVPSVAYCIKPMHSDLIIEENNADEWLNVAGLTKLPAVLTLCLAFDKGLIDENAEIKVSANAAAIEGPSAYLSKGETIAAKELIRAAVMISAGDAIVALSEHAFGSADVFLNNIELTMRSVGIEKELPDCIATYMTFSCKELISLGEAAVESPTFMKYCTERYAVLEHANGKKTELASANKLLTTLPGCIGLFTGSSKNEGYCGVFACRRGEAVYLCSVIGAQNSKTRFETASKLFEEAFANYQYYTICDPNEPVLEGYPVDGGETDAVDLYAKEQYSLLMKKKGGEPQKRIDLPETLLAPLDPEHAVGSIAFYDADGTLLLEAALYPKEAVRANGFSEILKRLFRRFINE